MMQVQREVVTVVTPSFLVERRWLLCCVVVVLWLLLCLSRVDERDIHGVVHLAGHQRGDALEQVLLGDLRGHVLLKEGGEM